MGRPPGKRLIGFIPDFTYFLPAGMPLQALEEVVLSLDELEALRLADLEGLYQEEAARQMNVSRPTFARIIETARQKIADALVHGKAIRIQGGNVTQLPPPFLARRGRGCCHRHRHGWHGGRPGGSPPVP